MDSPSRGYSLSEGLLPSNSIPSESERAIHPSERKAQVSFLILLRCHSLSSVVIATDSEMSRRSRKRGVSDELSQVDLGSQHAVVASRKKLKDPAMDVEKQVAMLSEYLSSGKKREGQEEEVKVIESGDRESICSVSDEEDEIVTLSNSDFEEESEGDVDPPNDAAESRLKRPQQIPRSKMTDKDVNDLLHWRSACREIDDPSCPIRKIANRGFIKDPMMRTLLLQTLKSYNNCKMKRWSYLARDIEKLIGYNTAEPLTASLFKSCRVRV